MREANLTVERGHRLRFVWLGPARDTGKSTRSHWIFNSSAHPPYPSCPIQILSRKIYHAASDRKKFSIHFYFNNNKLSTFQNSRINRKKSDSKICLFNFRLLRKEKNLKLSYRQTSIRRGKPSRRKTGRKIEREREKRERGKLEKLRVVSRMNQKVRRRKWGLSTGHDLKPNITTEGTFLEHVPSQCSP